MYNYVLVSLENNKTDIQSHKLQMQVDKEAVGLLRVQLSVIYVNHNTVNLIFTQTCIHTVDINEIVR